MQLRVDVAKVAVSEDAKEAKGGAVQADRHQAMLRAEQLSSKHLENKLGLTEQGAQEEREEAEAEAGEGKGT